MVVPGDQGIGQTDWMCCELRVVAKATQHGEQQRDDDESEHDDDDPDPRTLRAALATAEPNVRAVTGPTRGGITGFRRSHAAAIAAQRLVAGGDGDRMTTHREVEVVALAGQDAEQVAEFVASVLGPLGAPGDPAVARLRETVRVWLDEGEHAPRTAARLNTHRNTVLHRVARAEELIGHPIADRRLAVALALELVARMGARALGRIG